MRHSLSPWSVTEDQQGRPVWFEPVPGHRVLYVKSGAVTDARIQVWLVGTDRGLTKEQAEAETVANARLIEAAPKLLPIVAALASIHIDAATRAVLGDGFAHLIEQARAAMPITD